MQLTEIRLRNFGQHTSLVLDMNDPTVLIVGPSGSGKSMVLDAIKLLLTGEVCKPPLENYIQNRGFNFAAIEDLPKSASVAGKWLIDGQVMEIERTITATSTRRKLTWQGDTYTTADEVEKIINDVLEADRKAVSACVFPPQGELENLLFGTQREREELFVKLLLLSEYAKVAEQLEAQAKLVEYGMLDRTAMRDAIEHQRSQQEQTVAELSGKLAQTLDAQADIHWLEELIIKQRSRQTARGEYESREAMRLSTLEREGQLLSTIPQGMDLNAAIAEQETAVSQLSAQIQSHDAQLKLQREVRDLDAQIATAQAALNQAQQTRASLALGTLERSQIDHWNAKVLELQRFLHLRADHGKDVQQRQHSETTLRASQERLQVVLPERERLKVAWEEKRKVLDTLELKLGLRRQAVHEHVEGLCPICDGRLDPRTLEASLPVIEQETHTVKNEVQQLYQQLQTHSLECTRLEADIAKYTTLRDEAERVAAGKQAELQTLEASLLQSYPQGLPEVNAQLQELQIARDRLARLEQFDRAGDISRLGGSLQALMARAAAIDRTGLSATFDENSGAQLRLALQSHQAQVNSLRQTQMTLAGLRGQIEQAQEASVFAERCLREAEQACEQYLARKPAHITLDQPASDILTGLRARQDERNRLLGQVQEARLNLERTIASLREIDVKDQQDAAKRELARKLREARGVFLRQGLPLTYIRYCYQRLTDMANRNLEYLDADFSVSVNPEADVSMLFTRTGDPSGAVFVMDRLSGGQRVRLSVAFLLAIQQLILPGLGFLVLDEPSMHLGPDAVENMADLFASMRTALQNAGGQLIVCDHNELLLRSFGKVHKLGSS